MNRIFKYGIGVFLILTIISVLTYSIFFENFNLFGKPEIKIINTVCDDNALRQITIYEISGNSVTMPTVHVSIQIGCNGKLNDNHKDFFISKFYTKKKIMIKWLSLDSIELSYPKNFNPLKMEEIVKFTSFGNDSLNLRVIYKHTDEISTFDTNELNKKNFLTPNNTDLININRAIEEEKEKNNIELEQTIDKIQIELANKYEFSEKINLYGDFNADNIKDYVTLIKNKKTKEKGIIIIHGSYKNNYRIFGAGNKINQIDKNLNWMSGFHSIPKGKNIYPTLVNKETGDILGDDIENGFKLIGNGIYLYTDEACGGGIIYWDGNKYNWMHVE